MRIAVIGTGISGLAAAWLLQRHAEVTVYEKNAYVGGHTNTIDTPGGPPVDTGFIVFNEHNYPQLTAMFQHLKVASELGDMSFAASIDCGRIEYAGDNLNTLFAQRRNLLSAAHWRMLGDILRFNRAAKRALQDGLDPQVTLRGFLEGGGFSKELWWRYLLPMAAAIWSCPMDSMLEFPAASFLRFFHNHGLLNLVDRPRWRTVTGGSCEYVKKLLEPLRGRVYLNTAVTAVRRTADGVTVWDAKGGEARYDQVVMAAHGDQTLALLAGATSAERKLLGAFRYQDNRAVLHTDAALMPRRRKVWASWNYLADDTEDDKARVSVTYWMNKLQNLSGTQDYFVSLNPLVEPRPESVVYETRYEHPVFTREAMRAQERLVEIQGTDRIWFCGAWSGYGFHEDGLRSAVKVVQAMGHSIPWLEGEPAQDDAAAPAWASPAAEDA
jgi:predicted NAD/FAD-binding protein